MIFFFMATLKTIVNSLNDFQAATTTNGSKFIGNITTEFQCTIESSDYNNNNNWFVYLSTQQFQSNSSNAFSKNFFNFSWFFFPFFMLLFMCRWTVSTTMDNSMGQIVPMTSLALSQSMDSVNTATNEEEVSYTPK